MLVHAEIEAFLENRALACVDHVWNEWFGTSGARPRAVLLSLLAYTEGKHDGVPATLGREEQFFEIALTRRARPSRDG